MSTHRLVRYYLNLNLNEQTQTNKLSDVWAYNASNEYIVGDVCNKNYKMFYQTPTTINLTVAPCGSMCAQAHTFTKTDSFTSDSCIDFLWNLHTCTRSIGSHIAHPSAIVLTSQQMLKKWHMPTKIIIIMRRMAHALSPCIRIHSVWPRLM